MDKITFRLDIYGEWDVADMPTYLEIDFDKNYHFKGNGVFIPLNETKEETKVLAYTETSFKLLKYSSENYKVFYVKEFPFYFITFRDFNTRLELWKITKLEPLLILPMYRGLVFYKKKEYPAFGYRLNSSGHYFIGMFNFKELKETNFIKSLYFVIRKKED